MESEIRQSTPERLVYWYLRLNGFLLLENFIIHPDEGDKQRTDADILGVRFLHRSENFLRPMQDDPKVADCPTYVNMIIGEVKRGYCALNGPWTKPENANMQRILCALGCIQENELEIASYALYHHGIYETPYVTCRLFAFGNKRGSLPISGVPQILFGEMIRFIHDRIRQYEGPKSAVGNWAWDGQALREIFRRSRQLLNYEVHVRHLFDIPLVEDDHGE